MLTPQEIQEMKFEKALIGGYNMEQIDKFLDELLVDYTLLYKENAALKGKMRVLVDKIDEYREVDEEMRKALYTAQNTAKEIKDKANAEALVIVANAEAEAKRIAEAIERETYANAVKLREMRDICSKYAQTVRNLMEKAAVDITLTEDKSIDELIEKAIADSAYAEKLKSFDIELPANVLKNDVDYSSDQTIDEPTLEIQIDNDQKSQEDEDPDKVFDINLIREIAEDETTADKSDDFGETDDSYDSDEDDDNEDDVDDEDSDIEDEREERAEPRFKFNFADLKFGKNYKNND